MPKEREGRIPETPTLTTGEGLCLLFIRSAVLEAVSIVPARLALGSCPLSVQGCHSWHLPSAHATLMPFTMFDLRGWAENQRWHSCLQAQGMGICWSCVKGCVFKF